MYSSILLLFLHADQKLLRNLSDNTLRDNQRCRSGNHGSETYLESVLEPFDGLVTLDLVVGTDTGLASSALGDTLTRTGPITCQHPSHLVHIPKTHMQQ